MTTSFDRPDLPPGTNRRHAMTVEQLWRYPVKSMAGESLPSLVFGEQGGLGDRNYALIDVETGRVASAKLPRRWARLINCAARLDFDGAAPAVTVRLPDGTMTEGLGPDLDAALTDLLGAPVQVVDAAPDDATIDRYWPNVEGLALRDTETTGRIAAAAPGTFFDHAPVHLITTAALASIECERSGVAGDARRFRPNIVIDAGSSGDPFPENSWVRRDLVIGSARLRVSDPTPRCVVPTLAHGNLPADSGLLHRIAVRSTVPIPALGMAAMPSLGVYATVVSPGIIATGDTITFA